MIKRALPVMPLLAILLCPAPLPAQKATTQAEFKNLVWPPPPADPRIRFTAWYFNEFDLGAKKRTTFLDRLAGKAKDVLWLKQPIAVAVDDKGAIFVADAAAGLVGMDPVNHRMWFFSKLSPSALGTATGVAVDSKFVYVTDSAQDQVVVFDKAGHRTMAIGAADGIKHPVGIAVDEAKDLVVVVNAGNDQVLLFNRGLKLQKKVGSRGDKPGQFNHPTYCAMLPGTGFVVTDTANFRVQTFNYEGRFLSTFGHEGTYSGSFALPKGIAVDPDGHIYVVDAKFANFQLFRPDGQVLMFVGAGGNAPGFFQAPCGIAIGKDGSIYVADSVNARVQRFQYLPEPRKGGAAESGKQ